MSREGNKLRSAAERSEATSREGNKLRRRNSLCRRVRAKRRAEKAQWLQRFVASPLAPFAPCARHSLPRFANTARRR